MRLLYLCIILCALANHAFTQNEELILPIGMTDEEHRLMPSYLQESSLRNSNGILTPPTSPVRTMAEWEEMQAIVVTFRSFLPLLTEIIRAAQKECEVIVVTNNISSTQNYLLDRDIDIEENITFLLDNSNSLWVRDYGGNPVYTNDVDSLIMIDWIYNRPRPHDDDIPTTVAEYLDIPLYQTLAAPFDLVHTGGNFMADGLGKGFSSTLVDEENAFPNTWGESVHTPEDVNAIMQDFMGISEYVKMETLPYDGIHHIDMHMKLLDETTLLVGEYPAGIADGPQIEANIQYVLDNFTTSYDTAFDIIRIPMPPDENGRYPHQGGDYRTYANALFVNNSILVPTYEEEFDTTALRIWEESMPGYNVVGIDCNSIIPYGGAIHCITKEVGVDDPLWIAHEKLMDVPQAQVEGYTAGAIIKHRSGILSAKLWYQTNEEPSFIAIPMTLVDAATDTWSATIPEQAAGSRIQYYIEAISNSGKKITRPLPAPEGYFEFLVDDVVSSDDVNAPILSLEKIYPNPASAITVIPVVAEKEEWIVISLRDIHGKTLKTIFEGKTSIGHQNFFVDADKFSTGIYLVEMQSSTKNISQKLVIK